MTDQPKHGRGFAVQLAVRLARLFEGIWTVPMALALAGVALALSLGQFRVPSGLFA